MNTAELFFILSSVKEWLLNINKHMKKEFTNFITKR